MLTIFFSRDPGGTKLLSLIYKDFNFTPKSYITREFGKPVLDTSEVNYVDCPKTINSVHELEIFLLKELGISSLDPKKVCFLTASSNIDDNLEKIAWQLANEKKIRCILFLDQVFRFENRFKSPDNFVPFFDLIFSPIDIPLEIIGLYKTNKIVLTGYFAALEEVARFKESHLVEDLNLLKGSIFEKNNIAKGHLLVTYISEPESEIKGFEEIKYSTEEVIDLLSKSIITMKKAASLVIKLHPKQHRRENLPGVVFIKDEFDLIELIAVSDLVVGVKSIGIYMAKLLSKNFIVLDYLNSADEKRYTAQFTDSLASSKQDVLDKLIENKQSTNVKSVLIDWKKIVKSELQIFFK